LEPSSEIRDGPVVLEVLPEGVKFVFYSVTLAYVRSAWKLSRSRNLEKYGHHAKYHNKTPILAGREAIVKSILSMSVFSTAHNVASFSLDTSVHHSCTISRDSPTKFPSETPYFKKRIARNPCSQHLYTYLLLLELKRHPENIPSPKYR
jgi:hypothetical protein